MIESKNPETWIDLQNDVSQILSDCGMASETPKIIETVRGKVEVDVFAVDNSQKPEAIYICECKHWKNAIPQTVIHGFRTVVTDFGANWGLIISRNGFQSGSYDSIKNTNIKILNWLEFQDLFEERWYKQHFINKLVQIADPLIEYTEPINSRIFRKADQLSSKDQNEFCRLREKYASIADLASSVSLQRWMGGSIKLPLDAQKVNQISEASPLPQVFFEVVAYRDLLNLLIQKISKGLEEFDNVFGCRA